MPSVGDALPPIEGEPAQGLPVGALQEEMVPPVLIPVEDPPLPPVPTRLAELPGFVDEWRTGHMSPTEAKRMFCTLFAAYIVRVTGNLTPTGSYLAHPYGHTLKFWLESPEIGFPIKPDNYHCSEPKVRLCEMIRCCCCCSCPCCWCSCNARSQGFPCRLSRGGHVLHCAPALRSVQSVRYRSHHS